MLMQLIEHLRSRAQMCFALLRVRQLDAIGAGPVLMQQHALNTANECRHIVRQCGDADRLT
jgi:hypothetical protein